MKERLLNILDQSTCLTRRQMKDYLAGTMLPEEIHAAETHISSCPLCSMALEGFEANSDAALEAIASLNSGFLKEHFDSITPQIHLNSIAPAVPVAHHHTHPRKKGQRLPILKVAAVAAALVAGFGVFWLMERMGKEEHSVSTIAQNVDTTAVVSAAEAMPSPAAPAAMTSSAPKAAPKNKEANGQTTITAHDEAVRDHEPGLEWGEDIAVGENKPAPAAPPAKTAEQIEKMPSTNITDAASSTTQSYQSKSGAGVSLGGGRATGTAYVLDSTGIVNQGYAQQHTSSQFNNYSVADNYAASPAATSTRSLKLTQAATKPVKADKTRDKILAEDALANRRKEEAAKKESQQAKAAETDDRNDGGNALSSGDALYGKGNYRSALKQYNAAQRSGSKRERGQATIMAARCYRNMGNKAKASAVLKEMIDNRDPQWRAARRLLNEWEGNK